MILDNATHISSLVPAKGITSYVKLNCYYCVFLFKLGLCGFLWHFLLEKEITALSEAIKKV